MKMSSTIFCLFFTIVSSYLFTSCEDTNNNQDLSLIEASFEDINKAISEATHKQDPSKIKAGQYIKYEDNYQVELNEPQINSYYEGEVLEVLEEDNHYLVSLLQTSTSFKDSENPVVKKDEDVFVVNKKNSNKKNILLKTQLPLGFSSNSLMPLTKNTAQATTVKAYNLKVSKTKIPYPAAVLERLNCELEPCQMIGTRIRFHMHEFINKDKTNKVAIDRIYIENGSFLAGVYSSCQSQFVVIGNRDYYVKQCSVLRDFKE